MILASTYAISTLDFNEVYPDRVCFYCDGSGEVETETKGVVECPICEIGECNE